MVVSSSRIQSRLNNDNDIDVDDDTNDNNIDPITNAPTPRLVKRNLPFHQSLNEIQVENYTLPSSKKELYKLIRSDWFHVLLRLPGHVSFLLLLIVWSVFIVLWAFLYTAVDRIQPSISCGLGNAGHPIQFYAAWAFSLETSTTVGYGLPSSVNAFFESCPEIQIAIYFQMMWSMMFNAFILSFFYATLARCSTRGAQLVFSNKAIVSIHNDDTEEKQVRFQVRIYDIDSKSYVLESHVRMYAVLKDRPVPRPMRLIQPDDELNGMLLLSIPTVVTHHIDWYSMLHPPVSRRKQQQSQQQKQHHHQLQTLQEEEEEEITLFPYIPSGNGIPSLRQADSTTGRNEGIVCPICGEAYGSVERWIQHTKNFQTQETVGGYPIKNTHRSIPDSAFDYAMECLQPTLDITSIQKYFQQVISEIIVVVEGIEPTNSGVFLSLQSYQMEDVIFDATARFTPILSTTTATTDKSSKMMVVDLDKFHSIDYNTCESRTTTTTTTTTTTASATNDKSNLKQQQLDDSNKIDKQRRAVLLQRQSSSRYHDGFAN